MADFYCACAVPRPVYELYNFIYQPITRKKLAKRVTVTAPVVIKTTIGATSPKLESVRSVNYSDSITGGPEYKRVYVLFMLTTLYHNLAWYLSTASDRYWRRSLSSRQGTYLDRSGVVPARIMRI